jgi:hypothetical protein
MIHATLQTFIYESNLIFFDHFEMKFLIKKL